MKKNRPSGGSCRPEPSGAELGELTLLVPKDLAVAWQRCTWVLIQEKGQGRLESMEEMVRDFLVKHGC